MGSTFETVQELKLGATFTVGTEVANVINVAVQIFDRENKNEIGERVAIPFYLSDDAEGDDVVSSAPDNGIAIGTDGVMIEWTDNKAGYLISEVDGDVDINMTHGAGDKTVYLNLIMPDGQLYTSAAITFSAAIDS